MCGFSQSFGGISVQIFRDFARKPNYLPRQALAIAIMDFRDGPGNTDRGNRFQSGAEHRGTDTADIDFLLFVIERISARANGNKLLLQTP